MINIFIKYLEYFYSTGKSEDWNNIDTSQVGKKSEDWNNIDTSQDWNDIDTSQME